MSHRHRAVLQKCLPKLLQCRNVTDIIAHLFTHGILKQNHYSALLLEQTDYDRMSVIVTQHIMRGTIVEFDTFMNALRLDNTRVANELEYVYELTTEGNVFYIVLRCQTLF